MSNWRRLTGINHPMIGNLKELSLFFLLILSSVFCIASTAYSQSQFDSSPTMVLYKEIAEDCYPSALCDEQDTIHIVWQSDRKGNWDIYYTSLENSMHRKEFTSLTDDSEDDLFPSIAKDGQGNMWVVWVRSCVKESDSGKGLIQNSIHGKRLESQKTQNGVIEFISKDNCEIKSPSLISIDSDSMLLAWILREGEKQEIRYVICDSANPSKIPSESWKTISSNISNSRRIVLGKTKTGEIFALWDSMTTEDSNLYYSLFDEENRSFMSYEELESPEGKPFRGDTPSIVIRSEEPSMLFFRNKWNIYCSMESAEDTSEFPRFLEPVELSRTAALEDYPATVETSKEIYLFWTSNYTGDNEIFFCQNPHQNDFKQEIIYERGPKSANEEMIQFVKNLTRDPNQNNSNTNGEFCKSIFFSVSVIGEELWAVWDSYQWDLREPNNRRQIKYMKTLDEEGKKWSQPITVVNSSKSRDNYGRDDRHPVIVGAKGSIWLFWHSDRYRKENFENFEICYIYSEDGGHSWNWEVPDKDPYRLTESLTAKDICPSVSSIGDRIFVVWKCEESGDSNIFLCEFFGRPCDKKLPIADQNSPTPKWNPSLATYRGWNLASLGYSEELVISWESIEEGYHVCHFKTVDFSEDIFHSDKLYLDEFYTAKLQNMNISYPAASFISRHPVLGKILRSDLWCLAIW